MAAEPRARHGLEPERIVRLEQDAVVLLDQRRLPDEEIELRCASANEVADAIRVMAIRGAPAICVAAAYGYALAAAQGHDLDEAYETLASARPTAVNLRWALDEMRSDPTRERARALHEREVERCRRMAAHAAGLVPSAARVLTHCNSGGLATGGYGTALGAIRTAWEAGLIDQVWVDETRPRLQGARLTAWELQQSGIAVEVICDSSSGYWFGRGEITLTVVGAARIVKRGYPDSTAWDPSSDHPDPKSTPDSPIWYMVDIQAEKPFRRPVTLEEIKANPRLADMMLVRRGMRLSIQTVTPEEWEEIVALGEHP